MEGERPVRVFREGSGDRDRPPSVPGVWRLFSRGACCICCMAHDFCGKRLRGRRTLMMGRTPRFGTARASACSEKRACCRRGQSRPGMEARFAVFPPVRRRTWAVQPAVSGNFRLPKSRDKGKYVMIISRNKRDATIGCRKGNFRLVESAGLWR